MRSLRFSTPISPSACLWQIWYFSFSDLFQRNIRNFWKMMENSQTTNWLFTFFLKKAFVFAVLRCIWWCAGILCTISWSHCQSPKWSCRVMNIKRGGKKPNLEFFSTIFDRFWLILENFEKIWRDFEIRDPRFLNFEKMLVFQTLNPDRNVELLLKIRSRIKILTSNSGSAQNFDKEHVFQTWALLDFNRILPPRY